MCRLRTVIAKILNLLNMNILSRYLLQNKCVLLYYSLKRGSNLLFEKAHYYGLILGCRLQPLVHTPSCMNPNVTGKGPLCTVIVNLPVVFIADREAVDM